MQQARCIRLNEGLRPSFLRRMKDSSLVLHQLFMTATYVAHPALFLLIVILLISITLSGFMSDREPV
jgi:hypothetical protein